MTNNRNREPVKVVDFHSVCAATTKHVFLINFRNYSLHAVAA